MIDFLVLLVAATVAHSATAIAGLRLYSRRMNRETKQ